MDSLEAKLEELNGYDSASTEDKEDFDVVQMRINKTIGELLVLQQHLKTKNSELRDLQNQLLISDTDEAYSSEEENKKKTKKLKTRVHGTIDENDRKVEIVKSWYNSTIASGEKFSEKNIESRAETDECKNITKMLKNLRSESRRGKMTDANRVKAISTLDPILAAFFAKTPEQIKAETKMARLKRKPSLVPLNESVDDTTVLGELDLIRTMQHEIDIATVQCRQNLLKAKLEAM